MADNTTLNLGSGGDVLRTDDIGSYKIPASKIVVGADGTDGGFVSSTNPLPVTGSVGLTGGVSAIVSSGSITGLLQGGQAVSSANPIPVSQQGTVNAAVQSGSIIGLLVGGVGLSKANPLPTTTQSGSLTGLMVGGVAVSNSVPVPVSQQGNVNTYDNSGQILSGSTLHTVQYTFGDFGSSGSANQVVAPQGSGNRVRVLSVMLMASGPVNVRWQSTGSAGSVNNVSGRLYLPASGGFVLPHNPHGWFQTNTNEGLNISLDSATSVGINITWIVAGA